MSPLLRFDEARARRGDLEIGPVSLDVARGEVVALAGPNGAGKSSLLALATGELRPSSGAVRLLGDDPSGLKRADVARRAALVRQGAPPRLPLSAEELVLHGRWVHLTGLRFPGARDRGLAADALRRCGAEALAARDVRTLSGGEMQRVLLAKAVAQGSPLLLLDEPTSSLDLGHRARILRLLRRLAEAGEIGCLVVTHDLDLVADTCDRVVLLARGRVIAVGTPEEAFRPEALEAAHGIPVFVDRDPRTGRPRVSPSLDQLDESDPAEPERPARGRSGPSWSPLGEP